VGQGGNEGRGKIIDRQKQRLPFKTLRRLWKKEGVNHYKGKGPRRNLATEKRGCGITGAKV